MGLFDSFGAQMRQSLANGDKAWVRSGAPLSLSPVSGFTTDDLPKSRGLFSRFKEPDPETGMTGWDKLALTFAGLRDDPSIALDMQKMMALSAANQRQLALQQQKAAAQQELAKAIGPQAGSPGISPIGAFPGVAPVAATGPQTVRQALPALLQAAGRGVDITDYVSALDKAAPDVRLGPGGEAYDARDPGVLGRTFANPSVVNDTILNLNDPSNIGRQVPKAPEGMRVLYDENRNPVMVPIQGYMDTMAGFEGARAGAQKRAEGLYTPDTRTDETGAPVYGVAADRFGGGSPDVLRGQSPADATYQGDMAKAAAARYQSIQDAGSKADQTIANYQTIGSLLDGVNGNSFSGTGVDIARVAKSVGLDIDPKLPAKEAAIALSNKLALTLRDPSSGGGMPGSLSNSDRKYLANMVPNIGQTAAGRKVLIDAAVKTAQRNKEVAGMARKWQQRFGRLDRPDASGKTFDDYLGMWAEQNPLFVQ